MLPDWKAPRPRREPSRKLARPRIGPTMRAIADYVSAVPGCTKADALRGTDRPARGMGAYRPVNRAIAAGLVVTEQTRRCGPYRLFAAETDRQLWHLRRELMASASPARAVEIAAEVARLREAQVTEYAEAQCVTS
jgi:hypothetical protein